MSAQAGCNGVVDNTANIITCDATPGSSSLDALDGNDEISITGGIYTPPMAGDPELDGGAGDDIFTINISDPAFSALFIQGGAGSDTFTLVDKSGTVAPNLSIIGDDATGPQGQDVYEIQGGVWNRLNGAGQSDAYNFRTGSTANVVDITDTGGVGSADTLLLQDGVIANADLGLGTDVFTISGGTVSGSLLGNGGEDTFNFSDGNANTLDGGEDGDTYNLSGGSIGMLIDTGGVGSNDEINLTGTSVSDDINSGSGNDEITLDGSIVAGDIVAEDGADVITISSGEVSNIFTGRIGIDGTGSNADQVTQTGGIIDGIIVGDNMIDTITISGGLLSGGMILNGGNDVVLINGTADIDGNIITGTGADVITVDGGNISATIFGESGADTFNITNGTIAILRGEADNDDINISGGTITTVEAGSENDDIDLTGGVVGSLDAGDDNDTIDMFSGATADILSGGNDDDDITIHGGLLNGDGSGLAIDGGFGIDEIVITDGTINGTVNSGGGNDIVTVSGGTLTAPSSILGDIGEDIITITGTADVQGTVSGGTFGDIIQITGGEIDGNVEGNAGADRIIISAGTVRGTVYGDDTAGSQGEDGITISGSAVLEQAIFAGDFGDTVTINNGQINTVGASEAVNLGTGNDNFVLRRQTAAASTVNGDVLGDTGADFFDLLGGTIAGAVDGGAENDTIQMRDELPADGSNVGASVANIFGNEGADIIDLSFGTVTGSVFGDDAADNFSGADTITLGGSIAVNGNIFAGGDDDFFTFNGNANVAGSLRGDAGRDTFNLNDGTIGGSVIGGADNDVFNVDGTTVIGGLSGGVGNDTFELNSGLIGGGGIVGPMVDGRAGNDLVTVDSMFALAQITQVLGSAKISGGVDFDTLNLNTGAGATRTVEEGWLTAFEVINIINNNSGVVEIEGNGGITLDTGSIAGGTQINVNAGRLHLTSANSDMRAETVSFSEGSVLSGIGTIISTNTIIGGAHHVGLSPGTMNIIGDVTYGANASVIIEFDDTAPDGAINPVPASDRGVDFDAIDITGNLTITGGATLNIAFIDELAVSLGFMEGDQFDIYNLTGADLDIDVALNGDFTLVTNGAANVATLGFAWQTFKTDLGGGAYLYGIELVMAVPEPATALLVPGGIYGAVRLRRRRKLRDDGKGFP